MLSAVVLCAPGNTNYVFLTTPTFRFLGLVTPIGFNGKAVYDIYDVTNSEVSVLREGWFQDSLLGKTEIPFLDIEEWSGASVVSPVFVFRNNFSERMEQKPPVGQKRPSFANALVCCVFFLECFEFRTS